MSWALQGRIWQGLGWRRVLVVVLRILCVECTGDVLLFAVRVYYIVCISHCCLSVSVCRVPRWCRWRESLWGVPRSAIVDEDGVEGVCVSVPRGLWIWDA